MKSWRTLYPALTICEALFWASVHIILMLTASMCEGCISIPILQMSKQRLNEVTPAENADFPHATDYTTFTSPAPPFAPVAR